MVKADAQLRALDDTRVVRVERVVEARVSYALDVFEEMLAMLDVKPPASRAPR